MQPGYDLANDAVRMGGESPEPVGPEVGGKTRRRQGPGQGPGFSDVLLLPEESVAKRRPQLVVAAAGLRPGST